MDEEEAMEEPNEPIPKSKTKYLMGGDDEEEESEEDMIMKKGGKLDLAKVHVDSRENERK